MPRPQPDDKAEKRRLWAWRNAITADLTLKPSEKVVALVLSFHYDLARRTTWVPVDRLASECGTSRSATQRARKAVVDRGALRVVEAAHRGRATRYGLVDAEHWGLNLSPQCENLGPQPESPTEGLGPQNSTLGASESHQWGLKTDDLGPQVEAGVVPEVAPKELAEGNYYTGSPGSPRAQARATGSPFDDFDDPALYGHG